MTLKKSVTKEESKRCRNKIVPRKNCSLFLAYNAFIIINSKHKKAFSLFFPTFVFIGWKKTLLKERKTDK